jgi:DNA-directed RNA polymerase subunit alpha
MPRIPFQRPKKVEWEILSDRYGRLVAEPFEKGYGLTWVTSLRRALLSIVAGSAVSWVRIDGVRSPDTGIPGVKESTTDVLLNFKKLAIQVPSGEPKVLRLEVTGPRSVTGADVPETDVEIVNPEVHLMTIESNARVSVELGVTTGRGYETAEHRTDGAPSGAMTIDAAYSPITRVSYNVEMSRLGKITDYEKLVFELWTNGVVGPEDALGRAAAFLRDHFAPLSAAKSEHDEEERRRPMPRPTCAKVWPSPSRSWPCPRAPINALKTPSSPGVRPGPEDEADLEHVKNLGEKSIDEIKTALAALGLSLGMRIDPNVLGALGAGGVRMRHGNGGYKLGRVTQHRWALFRNLLVALFRHERIMTTEAKAKAVRGPRIT